jgi:predicted dehydrogenase
MRIGVLGAARITPTALIKPARIIDGVEIAAVAARDRRRAEAFAARWGVPAVHDSYAELLADPSLDAVYVPLPNGLHAQWTQAAVAAGKHVLCEKPFTANAAQARQVAGAAEASGLVVMEAFHYRYHPVARRMAELVHGGATGHIHASMWSSALLRIRAKVVGDRGTMTVTNPFAPHYWSRFTLDIDGRRRRERFDSQATYVHQLRAFAAAVRGEPTNLTPPSDSIATMSLIDDIYTAAALPLRT